MRKINLFTLTVILTSKTYASSFDHIRGFTTDNLVTNILYQRNNLSIHEEGEKEDLLQVGLATEVDNNKALFALLIVIPFNSRASEEISEIIRNYDNLSRKEPVGGLLSEIEKETNEDSDYHLLKPKFRKKFFNGEYSEYNNISFYVDEERYQETTIEFLLINSKKRTKEENMLINELIRYLEKYKREDLKEILHQYGFSKEE